MWQNKENFGFNAPSSVWTSKTLSINSIHVCEFAPTILERSLLFLLSSIEWPDKCKWRFWHLKTSTTTENKVQKKKTRGQFNQHDYSKLLCVKMLWSSTSISPKILCQLYHYTQLKVITYFYFYFQHSFLRATVR